MKVLSFTLLFVMLTVTNYAQVGIGTTTPNASAALDISSTTKGLLFPRMTTIQRNAIVAPVAGLQILNLDDYCLDVYNGIDWIKNCGYKMTGTDTAETSVTTVAPFGGVARDGAAGFSIGTKGYVGTGTTGTLKKDFWEYNPTTNVWTQKADFGGTARSSAVGFAVASKGYIGTGLDGAFKNDMWEYDPTPNTWTQKANLPANGRVDAVAFSISNYGYVGLGYYDPTSTMFQDMYEFYPATNTWATKTNCPIKMRRSIAFASSIFGFVGIGETTSLFGNYLTKNLFQFNPAGPGTWTQMPDFPGSARWNAVAVGINNIGYVTTGKEYAANYFKDLWQFNTNTNTWAPMPDISNTGRARAVAFAVNGAMYVGTGYDGAYKSDFIKYEPYPIGPIYANTLDVMAAGGISDGIWTKEFNKISTDNRININTDMRTLTHPTDRPFYLTGNLGYSSNGVEFCRNDGRQGIGLGYGFIYPAGTDVTQDLGIRAKGTDGDLFFYTNDTLRVTINPSGNLGIGAQFAHAPLQLSNSLANRKIVLYEAANDNHQFFGLGVNSGILRYQVGGTTNDHVFYAGVNGTTSNELMRIKGTGTVGIGTPTPNASAILDVSSTTKGMLIPRMMTNERTAIVSPATGLLVFDITTNSFWFKGSFGWMELLDNLDTEVFRNGPDKIYMGLTDSVGIGTNNPTTKLEVRTAINQYGFSHTDGSVRISSWIGDGGEIGTVSNHIFRLFANNGVNQFQMLPNGNIGIGMAAQPQNKLDILSGAARTGTHATGLAMYLTGDLLAASGGLEIRHANGTQGVGIGYNTIYATGSNADQNLSLASRGTAGALLFQTNNVERMRINGAGQVGIGTSSPHAQLQLATSVANRKLILYEVADNDHQYHGFGINGDGALRYQTANTLNDHVFYAATSSTTSNELARIKGNGNLAVTGIIETEAFIAPTLLNTFTIYGAGYAAPGYYKDKMGRVHLRGLVNNANNPSGLVIFILPAGYRPATSGTLVFVTINNGTTCRVDIGANGNVVVNSGVAGWVSLDGIDFRAD